MKLLDTSVCIPFLNGADTSLKSRFRQHHRELVLCSVVKAELVFGALESARSAANLERLHAFFETLPSLAFDDEAALRYASARASLRRAGTPIGPNDLLIAATALVHDATVISRNVTEFSRVPGLVVERW